MPKLNSRFVNSAALIVVAGYFGINLLTSPHFQVLRSLQVASETGRLSPPETDAPFGGDFLSEWVAGYMIRAGDRSRLYDPRYADELEHDAAITGFVAHDDLHLYLFYPPGYYLLVTPLSLLPVQWAAVIWYLLNFGCLVVAVALLTRANPGPPWLFGAALVAAAMFLPLYISINSGQKGTFWLLVFSASYYLLRRREMPFGAGIVSGLLLLKPPLALATIFIMLWKRQTRFLAGLAVTASLILALSLALGLDICEAYVRLFTLAANFTMAQQYPRHTEHCWYGFFALLTGGQSPAVVRALTLVMDVVTLLLLGVLFRGPLRFTSERFPIQYCGLIFATALVSLKFQNYDLAIMMLPAIELSRLYLSKEFTLGPTRLGLICVALIVFLGLLFSDDIAKTYSFQVSVWLMLGALASLLATRRLDEKKVGLDFTSAVSAHPTKFIRP
jgi:hypothetical protein